MAKEKKQQRGRSLFASFFLCVLFSLLLIHYYKIQIIEHDKWVKIAEQQHHLVIKEPFMRGKILCKTSGEKEGRAVVRDVLTFHLFIDPVRIKEPLKKEMIGLLGDLLETDNLSGHFYKRSRHRKIAAFLPIEKKEEIELWWKGYAKEHRMPNNAMTFVKDFKRSYPYDHFLGQVLSTVYKNRDERTGQVNPISGIEKQFDANLKGEVGKRYLMRSPKYRIDDAKRHVHAKNGDDVHLTIHHQIQAICEEELKKGVEKVKGKGGLAVMMDPFTGEVMALAQYPFFSPEKYSQYFNSEDKKDIAKPKVVTDCFEPGSIMKVLTLAIGLKANEKLLEKGEKSLFCPYEMVRSDDPNFKGRKKPLFDVSTHKYLNMFLAVQKSSNIYAARIIERVLESLGPGWYSDQLQEVFGLGRKTGIELPYESPGMVPIYGKKYANGKDQWSDPTPYSLAIGYNILVNPLQMARAYSVFANGGYLVEPTLVSKVVNPEGKTVYSSKKEKRKVISKDIADIMMQALKFTTKSGGTSHLADIPGFSEGGKSSTTEKIVGGVYSKNTHLSNFIGIAPAKNPKFVLIVVVDEPEKRYIPGFGTTHYGGKCAAPVFREIGKRALQILNVPYDDPYGFNVKDPRTVKEQADWYLESKELKAMYDEWNV